MTRIGPLRLWHCSVKVPSPDGKIAITHAIQLYAVSPSEILTECESFRENLTLTVTVHCSREERG